MQAQQTKGQGGDKRRRRQRDYLGESARKARRGALSFGRVVPCRVRVLIPRAGVIWYGRLFVYGNRSLRTLCAVDEHVPQGTRARRVRGFWGPAPVGTVRVGKVLRGASGLLQHRGGAARLERGGVPDPGGAV